MSQAQDDFKGETLEQRQERVRSIIALLKGAYPDSRCSLDYRTPLELLVATILSAQCTDVRVNLVTPQLFKRFPDAPAYSAADLTELEEVIRSTGFYKSKARNIKATGQRLVAAFGGEVPRTMPELLSLPGVARKTANVVMGNAYGLIEGVVVDTHVGRISRLLGLTIHEDPAKVEQDLLTLVPQPDWLNFSHLLIDHGRKICQARRPLCEQCLLNMLCPSSSV